MDNQFESFVAEFSSDLPNVDLVTQDMISIPVGWWVNPEDRERIVECIKRGW
jgi:hypothetical protein